MRKTKRRILAFFLLVAGCTLPLAAASEKPPKPPAPPAPAAPPAPPAPPKAPEPTPPRPPAPPRLPAPPELPPHARLGFSFGCGNCGYRPNASGVRAWTFAEPPVVEEVESGGPAAGAGLRPGDRLVRIDGVPLSSSEGGRRFTDIEPGDTVQWTVERAGQPQTVRMVAEAKPDPRPAKSAEAPLKLRYNGALGPAQVEVRGAPVNVTEDEQTGELVIRSHDLLVRVTIPGERRPRG